MKISISSKIASPKIRYVSSHRNGDLRPLVAARVAVIGCTVGVGAAGRALVAAKVVAIGRTGVGAAGRPLVAAKVVAIGRTGVGAAGRTLVAAKVVATCRTGVEAAGRPLVAAKVVVIGQTGVGAGARSLRCVGGKYVDGKSHWDRQATDCEN